MKYPALQYPHPTVRIFHTDRKSTRLNSSHGYISYAVFCLKKKTNVHDVSVALDKVTDHDHRVMVLDALVRLLKALTQAGVQHQDLNVKSILLTAAQAARLD